MKKDYCTQNNGKCSSCPLANSYKDCQNNPIWGGKREGAGRPPTGRKKHQYYATDEEHVQIKAFIKSLRKAQQDETE